MPSRVGAQHDTADTTIHDRTETVIASLEGLTLGVHNESEHIEELREQPTDETVLANRTLTERHPSIKRMPHVVGVSCNGFFFAFLQHIKMEFSSCYFDFGMTFFKVIEVKLDLQINSICYVWLFHLP